MSGHSHAKTVARVKNADAAKRSKAFSKIACLLSMAAKEGGDPESNSKLRMAMEQAKKVNMPKENIERAIKRGTGEMAGESLEEVSFEVLTPDGIALIIEGITDNKNRTFQEIKQILHQHNGKLAGEGSVKWMFERKGIIITTENQETTTKEGLELKAIEAGAEDIKWKNNILEIYTKPDELDKVKSNLEKENIKIESVNLEWTPKEEITANKEKIEKLLEALDENDAVQNIYSNLKSQ